MAQYEMNLRDYWFIIRRRRAIIAMSTVLVTVFSFWFAQQKVPVYQATAAVKYEQSTAVSGLLVEVLSYSTADSIETQTTLIKSTPILEEVARQLGRLPETTGNQPLRETKAYWSALDGIGGKIKVNRVPSTSILEVTATSTDPVEAKQLANTVVQVYRKYNRDSRNTRIVEARKFIESQLKDLEGRGRRAEEELWAFRDANRIIAPGAESGVLLGLYGQLRSDIEKARQQRAELESAAERLARTERRPTEPLVIETGNPAVQRLQQAQNELILERNTLALDVTERHPRLQVTDDRIREVRAELRRQVGAQIGILRSREEILNRQLAEVIQRNQDIPTVELGLQRRQREAKVNDDLLALLKTKHQEALIKESEAVEEVSIVRPAAEPDTAVGSEKLNTILVGALLGLMVGLVMAFVQETLDTSIGTIEDVESYLEVPVLGVVPHIDTREATQRLVARRPELANVDPDALRNHALLITHFDPKSPVAEAYRTLRTNIQFARLERAGKILVLTSPTLQEGKTTTIVNLALTMAQNGQKTLLLGANLRRPSIHRFFGIDREPGLSDILVGRTPWRDAIRTVADILMGRFEMEDVMVSPGLDNLHIIESGPIPANPSELVSTRAMGELLAAVRSEYDIVLIDTPPVLPVTDAAIVASQVDGVILVYQAGKIGRLVLRRAKVNLESVGAKVWGVVLNDVHTEIAGYQYTHYYTHYYGEETPAQPPRHRLPRLEAVWQAVRSKLPGATMTPPTTAPPPAATESLVTPEEPEPVDAGLVIEDDDVRRPRRSWRFWAGLLLGTAVLVALAATLAWRAGWLGAERRVTPVRQRLDSALGRSPDAPRAAPAPAPPAPGSPSTPGSSLPPAQGTRSAPSVPTPGIAATTTPVERPSAAGADTEASARGSGALAPDRRSPPTPTAPATTTPALTAPTPTATAPTVTAPSPRTGGGPTASTRPPTSRFAVEFGPFAAVAEAERIERTLNHAGYQTVRFRQQTGAALYEVRIERVPSARGAQALVATLRDQGFPDPVVLGDTEPLAVRVGDAVPLRGAVQLAERARAQGHQVRVAATPGEAVMYVIRHGNFSSQEDAEARSQELARLGLPNQAVRVK